MARSAARPGRNRPLRRGRWHAAGPGRGAIDPSGGVDGTRRGPAGAESRAESYGIVSYSIVLYYVIMHLCGWVLHPTHNCEGGQGVRPLPPRRVQEVHLTL